MTQNEIIRIAKASGFEKPNDNRLQYFAELVAAHTLMNIDPRSFMSYQEGFEAGNRLAIEGFCRQIRQIHDAYSCASDPSTLRARGEA